MTDILLRTLLWATVGLALSLLLRRPARRVFGAGPAFTLWLLPVVLAFAPFVPHGLAPAASWSLPALLVTPDAVAAARSSAPMDWYRWLAVLWLIGAAAGLVRLAVHYVALRRGALRVPSAWKPSLADAAPDLDPRRVRVHAAGPAVLWALPRSLILLPADFAERFDPVATRELVLRHELTHARRGDAWWTLAMEIATALLWFHPLAWLARSRFRLDQELACDAASLRGLPERTVGYARALLDSAATQPLPALIPWLAEPQLKERIAMITRIPPNALRRRAGFIAIAALIGGGLLFAAGQVLPVQAATHANAASSSPRLVYQHSPVYPVEAIKKGEQGVVMLNIAVDASGQVTAVAVDPVKTTAPLTLQTAAVRVANNWRFKPGMKGGHTVAGRIEVPVTFMLQPHSLTARAFRRTTVDGKSYYSCVDCRSLSVSREPRN